MDAGERNTKERKTIRQRLSLYNSIVKENDEIYRMAARRVELPDAAFWILYILRESEIPLTQSEICSSIYMPKQTVNSALKKLETEGYIEQKAGDDRRRKLLSFTEKGEMLAQKTIDRVLFAEQNAFAQLPEKEQEAFLQLFRKYTDLLRENLRAEALSDFQR